MPRPFSTIASGTPCMSSPLHDEHRGERHAHPPAADSDDLAHRILTGKHLPGQFGTHHRHGRAAVHLLVGKKGAPGDLDLTGQHVVVGRPQNRHLSAPLNEGDLLGAHGEGSDPLDLGDPPHQGLGIFACIDVIGNDAD